MMVALRIPVVSFEIRNNDGKNVEADAIASFEINTIAFGVQISAQNSMKVCSRTLSRRSLKL